MIDQPAGPKLLGFDVILVGTFLAGLAAFAVMLAIYAAITIRDPMAKRVKALEARREQIAGGLANAATIKARLAQVDAERRDILMKAEAEGQQLIQDARAAAARLETEETQKAIVVAEQIRQRAHDATERERAQMLADVKREVGRLVVQTTASVTGKILTPDDHRRLAEETARQLS